MKNPEELKFEIETILINEEEKIKLEETNEKREITEWDKLTEGQKNSKLKEKENKLVEILRKRKLEENQLINYFNTKTNKKFKAIEQLVENIKDWDELSAKTMIEITEKAKDVVIKDYLIKSMTGKKAHSFFWQWLLAEFKKSDYPSFYRWTLGNIMAIISENNDDEIISEIINNKRYGKAREQLVFAFAKIKGKNAENSLLNLITDPEIYLAAVISLGNIGSKDALPYIKLLANHPDPYFRKKIKLAIVKIEKTEK